MQEIKTMAKKMKDAGGTLYLVGGAIRDELLGRKVHDKDYAVEGLTLEQFQTLFPEAKVRGKDFSVLEIEGTEFALTRREKKIGKGHKEFEIDNDQVRIEEDLRRRDITINAIAKEVLTGKIIDPFDGRGDLSRKQIRATSEAFKEDPLRVYRVARLAASLEFTIEENTIKQMQKLKEELKTLSKERVFTEFRKALETQKPSIFFETLKKTGLLEIHFKEIRDLIGSTQPEKYHPEGDSFNHTMLVVDKAASLTKDILIRFGALVHDLGKGVTPKEILPHHYGHDRKGVEVVEKFCYQIGTPTSWKKVGQVASRYHMLGGIFKQLTPAKKVDFLETVSKSRLGLEGLQLVVIADKCSSRNCEEEMISFAKIGKEMLKEVTGRKIQEKYPQIEGIPFKERLREERIKWIKENVDNF